MTFAGKQAQNECNPVVIIFNTLVKCVNTGIPQTRKGIILVHSILILTLMPVYQHCMPSLCESTGQEVRASQAEHREVKCGTASWFLRGSAYPLVCRKKLRVCFSRVIFGTWVNSIVEKLASFHIENLEITF